ncbi:MFS transporter [Roseateles sp.]|uniref:MFS transporter n=1 Tax=Roseateles sp. TaxID=1971397 RepID=UPI0039ECDFDF
MNTPTATDAAPDGAATSSWTAIIALAVAAFALVSTEFLPVGLLPQIARELGITEGQAGLMVTLPGLLAAFAAPMTIAFAGNIDRRWLLGGLLGLLVLSNVAVAFSGSFAFILLGRVLLGLAVGGFWTIGGSLGPRLKPGSDAAKASALILSGVSIGTVAGVPAGALLGELMGWRWAFGVASAVSVSVLVLLLAVLPPLPASESSKGLRDIPDLLKEPKVRLGLIAIVLVFVGQFASYTYISPFLIQVTGIAPVALGGVLLGYGVAGFLGNIVGGWLASRSLRGALVATGMVLGLSVLLLVLLGSSAWWAVPLTIIWGLGFGMLPIAMQSWMFGAAPNKLEAVQAVFVSVAQAAIGSGALLGGQVVDHFGVSSALWLGASAALATALVVAVGTRAQGGNTFTPTQPA